GNRDGVRVVVLVLDEGGSQPANSAVVAVIVRDGLQRHVRSQGRIPYVKYRDSSARRRIRDGHCLGDVFDQAVFADIDARVVRISDQGDGTAGRLDGDSGPAGASREGQQARVDIFIVDERGG